VAASGCLSIKKTSKSQEEFSARARKVRALVETILYKRDAPTALEF
jgi:hypothetical protein